MGGNSSPGERGLRCLKFNELITGIYGVPVEQLRHLRLCFCTPGPGIHPKTPRLGQEHRGTPLSHGWGTVGQEEGGKPRPSQRDHTTHSICLYFWICSCFSPSNLQFILMAAHSKAGDHISQKTTTLSSIISSHSLTVPFSNLLTNNDTQHCCLMRQNPCIGDRIPLYMGDRSLPVCILRYQ